MANRKRPKMVSISKIYDSSNGVWRTIGGRRVFIKTGQSLSDAMKESGKFKTKMNGKAVKGAREEDLKEQYKDSLNNVSKMEYNGEITKDDYDKAVKDINKAYIDKRNEYVGIKKEDNNFVKSLSGEYETDNRGRKVTQKEYDDFRQAYRDGKISKEDYRNDNYEALKNIKDDKFYTRKDGTKEYDPYKGTRFEKKYDSVEDALNDPNHPTRKYIDEKLNWREQVKRNNELMEKELEDYKKSHDISRESDGYYEIFRNNERRNAKIKQEVPTEPYEYVEAYAGYHDKSYKLAGTKMSGKDVVEYGRNSWTGKEYTNDEFMEHLTDSNWHQERKMLEEAKLTNEELSYIKDHTTLSQWSVGEELTGSKNTQKMIDEAKDYSKYAKKIREKQNTPYYKQQMNKAVNDLQSSALENKYKGTVDYLKQTTNMSGAEILELLKKIDEDKK